MSKLTRKEKLILDVQRRAFGCYVTNLPLGIACGYRAHFCSEIQNHERKHADAIQNNRRTNARYFEIPLQNLQTLRYNLDLDSQTVQGNDDFDEKKQTSDRKEQNRNYTALCAPNGKVVYTKTETILNVLETKVHQIQSDLIDSSEDSLSERTLIKECTPRDESESGKTSSNNVTNYMSQPKYNADDVINGSKECLPGETPIMECTAQDDGECREISSINDIPEPYYNAEDVISESVWNEDAFFKSNGYDSGNQSDQRKDSNQRDVQESSMTDLNSIFPHTTPP